MELDSIMTVEREEGKTSQIQKNCKEATVFKLRDVLVFFDNGLRCLGNNQQLRTENSANRPRVNLHRLRDSTVLSHLLLLTILSEFA